MNLQEILRAKGEKVFTISPDATLGDVVQQLVAHRCGSLVVCEGEQMVGIITERDILLACASRKECLDELSAKDFMSPEPVTGRREDKVENVMGLMTSKRIRHLPIVEDGKLVGMISIGDVVKSQHDRLTAENYHLKSYIRG